MSKQTERNIDQEAVEKAKALLHEQHQKAIQACSKEINEVLKKYNLSMDARAVVNLVPSNAPTA